MVQGEVSTLSLFSKLVKAQRKPFGVDLVFLVLQKFAFRGGPPIDLLSHYFK